ncbi:AraC family transcriptional regulator [Paenibacillus hodogayensis]|uniref:AraC family transcriptional regulator n=1 Tax=Paenibacillus hodogayensis TaxID=279208 RepID=A0ABV5VZI6_9BACL
MEPMKKKEDFEGTPFPFKMSIQQRIPNLVNAHWHEHPEFIRVLKGPVTVQIDSDTFIGSEGDLFFINSNRIHSVMTQAGPDGRGGEIQGMVFDKSLLLRIADSPNIRHALTQLAASDAVRSRYDGTHPLTAGLLADMEAAYREFTARDLGFELGIAACIYRMMTALLRLHRPHPSAAAAADAYAAYSSRLKPAVDYMESRFAEKVYMEAVCQTVNMSLYHFSSMFKKAFGIPPIQYLTRIRIGQAKRMLVDLELPITEIAERCGFCNINYFDKVFKRQSGFTPLEYRKRFAAIS